MTTAQTLFGNAEATTKQRTLRFKVIRAVYETLTVREPIPEYINSRTRITQPETVWEMFKFLAPPMGSGSTYGYLASLPAFSLHVQTPILDRLGDMLLVYPHAPFQARHGSGLFQSGPTVE